MYTLTLFHLRSVNHLYQFEGYKTITSMAITDLVLQASKTNLNSFVQIVRFLRSSTKFIQNLAIIKKCIFSYDADHRSLPQL